MCALLTEGLVCGEYSCQYFSHVFRSVYCYLQVTVQIDRFNVTLAIRGSTRWTGRFCSIFREPLTGAFVADNVRAFQLRRDSLAAFDNGFVTNCFK